MNCAFSLSQSMSRFSLPLLFILQYYGASNAHGRNFFLPNQLIRATESCLFIWVLKISKSFSEILMSRALTRGLKLLKIGIFHKNRLFSVEIFLYSTTSMVCHISLKRSANTEKNGI